MWKKQMISRTSQAEASSSRAGLNRGSKRRCVESDNENDRRAADRKPSGEMKKRKYNEDHLRLLQIHEAREFRTRHHLKRHNKSLRQENEELRRQLRLASEKEDRFRKTIDVLVRKTAEEDKTAEVVRELRAKLAEKQERGDYFQNILVDLRETIEKQFRCSVCTEVLINASTLHCGHTFCSNCLEEWERLNPSCPFCRAAIRCKHPTKLVDDHIDYLVEHFYSDDEQNTRSNLVQERIRRKEERAQEPLPQRVISEPINIILGEDFPRAVQMYIMTRVFDEHLPDFLNQINQTAAAQQDLIADLELPPTSPRSRTLSTSSTDSDATVVLSETDLASATDFQPF